MFKIKFCFPIGDFDPVGTRNSSKMWVNWWHQLMWDQNHWLENKLATKLLLQKVVLPDISASHSSSVETYTVSGINWIRYTEHLDLKIVIYWSWWICLIIATTAVNIKSILPSSWLSHTIHMMIRRCFSWLSWPMSTLPGQLASYADSFPSMHHVCQYFLRPAFSVTHSSENY